MAYGLGQGVGTAAGSALAGLIPGAGPFLAPFGGAAGGWFGSLFDRSGNAQQPGQQGQQQAGFFQGNPGRFEQVSPYNQQQQQLFGQVGQHGWNQIQNPTAGFDPIRQRAMMEFQNKTIPGLAERFTSSTNAKFGSPAFQSQYELAGSDLQSQLAALEAEYGLRNQSQGLQMLQLGLSPQYQNQWMPPQGGFNQGVGQFLQGILPTIGQAGIQGFSGYMGGREGIGQGQKNFWDAISYSNALNGAKGTP